MYISRKRYEMLEKTIENILTATEGILRREEQNTLPLADKELFKCEPGEVIRTTYPLDDDRIYIQTDKRLVIVSNARIV